MPRGLQTHRIRGSERALSPGPDHRMPMQELQHQRVGVPQHRVIFEQAHGLRNRLGRERREHQGHRRGVELRPLGEQRGIRGEQLGV
jgi:hypothetical protein